MVFYVTCGCGTVRDIDFQTAFNEQMRFNCMKCGKLLQDGI